MDIKNFILALVIALVSAVALFCVSLLEKRFLSAAKIKKSVVSGKVVIVSIIALIAFILRYFADEQGIKNIVGIASSPFSAVPTVLIALLIWLEMASLFVIVLFPFYKIEFLSVIVKYFATPVFVLTAIFSPFMAQLFSGQEGITLCSVAFAIEGGAGLAAAAFVWLTDPKFKISWKQIGWAALIMLGMLAVSYPAYTMQLFFGRANALINIKDITPEHRLFLYGAFIIPLTLYILLRKKSKETIDFALVFFSVVTMMSYSLNYTFADALNPVHLPLHLCNTAMYIVPLCLIFKWEKLFYFTYFINVMGALLAMAMPNYADGTNLFETRLNLFWINHYCAFFMPILIVALKVFPRPKLKQFIYSMVAFAVYFLVILVVNGWFSNYGEVDFFFLNSDFIVSKLGAWAERLRLIVWEFDIANLHFVYYPVYQALFFVVYVLIALGVWFVYEQAYSISDGLRDLLMRKKAIKLEEYAFMSSLKDQKITEPLNPEGADKLIIRNFTKRYGASNVYAVRDANLEVHGGEIFGFLGPNGAGKSTIIKSIVGIQPITSGNIEVCGYDVEKQPIMAKGQIGYVPDNYALYERLTGREYINYIADIYDVGKEERNERMEKYVELFEMQGAIDNSMRTYSHGMKQKITIMAALIHNPKLWILDEPLTGLDPNSIFQVKECMKNHAKAGNIVFFSSHIIDVVEKICDRITIIKKGKILCTKDISEFDSDENSLEKFYLKTIEQADVERDIIIKEKTQKAEA